MSLPSTIFSGGLMVLIFYHVIRFFTENAVEMVNTLLYEILGFVAFVVLTVLIIGITTLIVGLSSESISILYKVSMLVNILFSINLEFIALRNFQIGLGLGSRIMDDFTPSFAYGIPYFLSFVFCIIILLMGLIETTSGGGE